MRAALREQRSDIKYYCTPHHLYLKADLTVGVLQFCRITKSVSVPYKINRNR